MHKRRVILNDIRDQLDSLPYFGIARIQRIAPSRESFPSITLFAESESVDHISNAIPRSQLRVLTISVIAWLNNAQDDEKTELDMDQYALEIEGALTKPSHAEDIHLVSTDFLFAEDDTAINALTLTYKITYLTTELNPQGL